MVGSDPQVIGFSFTVRSIGNIDPLFSSFLSDRRREAASIQQGTQRICVHWTWLVFEKAHFAFGLR
jgi:hypothetical protein